MLLRSLPDLSSSNEEFSRWFHSRWGRENCIVSGRARRAEFGPYTHTLSIRAAWGGTELCHLSDRTIGVDDDNFLILNHGRVYSTSIRSTHSVESFAICFRPGLVEQTCGAMATSFEQALAQPELPAERTPEFMENLQPHNRTITPVLRFIKAHLIQGVDDEAWYEEQLVFLLERMQDDHRRVLEHVDGLRLIRAATRREAFRRIRLATDFMQTDYAHAVDLEMMAKVAYLSKYHFLRLFTLVHGMTPFMYLQRKRTGVALRMLQATTLTIDEIASSVGFAGRSTLLRQIRRCTGLTPLQVRKQIMGSRREPSCRFPEPLANTPG